MKCTKLAAKKARKALEKRRLAQSYGDDEVAAQGYRKAADELIYEAEHITQLDTLPTIGHGKEAVPAADYLHQGAGNDKRLIIKETLETPDAVSTEASISRLDCLQEADCLEFGLDVADSIQADNFVEKMIAHQLGLCHKAAMTFMGKSMNVIQDNIRQVVIRMRDEGVITTLPEKKGNAHIFTAPEYLVDE